MSVGPAAQGTSERIVRWLRCPDCHGPLTVSGAEITCASSGFRGSLRDDVAVMMPEGPASFFDDKFHVMRHGRENKGEWDFCYARQTEMLTASLRPGMLVLDVGCGPVLPYAKPGGVSVVGLEPSFQSIRANTQVDLRVYGSAYSIPMAGASADVVVCLYAIHHMVGATVRETVANVDRAFREFGRVLKPGGTLLIFEMTPLPYFQLAQALYWNPFKRILGGKLDMHFYSAGSMERLGQGALPRGSALEKIAFQTSPFSMIAPVFSLPRLKVPRMAYPLDARLYKWRMPSA